MAICKFSKLPNINGVSSFCNLSLRLCAWEFYRVIFDIKLVRRTIRRDRERVIKLSWYKYISRPSNNNEKGSKLDTVRLFSSSTIKDKRANQNEEFVMEHWYSSVYNFPFSPHPHPNLSHFPANSIVVSGLLDFDHVINARQNRIELRRENLWLKTWRFIHLCCILRPFMNNKLVTWVRRLVKMFAGLDMEYKKGGILQTT